jgi:tRNA-splicing ligase RtcB
MNLKKLDDYRYMVEKTGKMNVPGIIYANEHTIKKVIEDKAVQQVENVATLPGIEKASLAMPDVHWGYGFPIGGVAAFRVSDGVISPGGIGYDINCLSGDSEVLTEFGYRIKIKDFEKIWQKEKIVCFDFEKDKKIATDIVRFIKFKPKNDIYKITLESGQTIIATEDHPFYTKDGMKEIKYLKIGDEVGVYPFEGVMYEEPKDEILVSEEDLIKTFYKIKKLNNGSSLEQILIQLKEKQLLPLKYNSSKLPIIIKLLGYIFGDGNIHFVKSSFKGVISFWGKEETLEEIKKDVEKLGFSCRIYKRERKHCIRTYYKNYNFTNFENVAVVSSSSLALLFVALGTPLGNKVCNKFSLPKWIFETTLWQKRLFLASYFGAEMSKPKVFSNHKNNFYCPVVSLNKLKSLFENGRKFLFDISKLLQEFGVETKKISVDYFCNKKDNCRLRIILSNTPQNLINLYSKIGFEYNKERQFLANAAVFYLKLKDKVVKKRQRVAEIVALKKLNGESLNNLLYLINEDVNFRFLERRYYEQRKTQPRIPLNFISFDEFVKEKTEGLGESGIFWDKIEEIEKIDFDDYVYDFTVSWKHHNFVANSFVVSNCGVRSLRTNLTKEEIKPYLEKLVYALFNNVPSGVGSTGKLRLSIDEVKEVLKKGANWALQHGFGSKEDLEFTEENGCMEEANPEVVSERALERGREQLGTLGAGNHFLEIQYVEQIYDENIAKVFGLFKDQVTVLVHTGSRGLGYQICDDYIRYLQQAVQKYGIWLPDRQLVCAPIDSPEGKRYFQAMVAAANYAWANRQIITHWVRETIMHVLNKSAKEIGLEQIYDVAHNIGKFEEYNGKKYVVHRKGATRAFPKEFPGIPQAYKDVGQPVLVPGSMGTASYVLVGTEKAVEETWGSTCHGAGRVSSRSAILKSVRGEELAKELREKGILVKSDSWKTLAEEAPQAYKNVDEVVEICHQSGISRKVARLKPLAVIKG